MRYHPERAPIPKEMIQSSHPRILQNTLWKREKTPHQPKQGQRPNRKNSCVLEPAMDHVSHKKPLNNLKRKMWIFSKYAVHALDAYARLKKVNDWKCRECNQSSANHYAHGSNELVAYKNADITKDRWLTCLHFLPDSRRTRFLLSCLLFFQQHRYMRDGCVVCPHTFRSFGFDAHGPGFDSQ